MQILHFAFLAKMTMKCFPPGKNLSHRNYWTAKKMKSRSDELLQPSRESGASLLFTVKNSGTRNQRRSNHKSQLPIQLKRYNSGASLDSFCRHYQMCFSNHFFLYRVIIALHLYSTTARKVYNSAELKLKY